jgi:hypothetical protein
VPPKSDVAIASFGVALVAPDGVVALFGFVMAAALWVAWVMIA